VLAQEAAITHVREWFGCARVCRCCLETRCATRTCSWSVATSSFWVHGTREGRQQQQQHHHQQQQQHQQLQPTEIIHYSSAFNFAGHGHCAQHSLKRKNADLPPFPSPLHSLRHSLLCCILLKACKDFSLNAPFQAPPLLCSCATAPWEPLPD